MEDFLPKDLANIVIDYKTSMEQYDKQKAINSQINSIRQFYHNRSSYSMLHIRDNDRVVYFRKLFCSDCKEMLFSHRELYSSGISSSSIMLPIQSDYVYSFYDDSILKKISIVRASYQCKCDY